MRSLQTTHVRTPALDYQLYHNLIVIKNKQMSTPAGNWCAWWKIISGFLDVFLMLLAGVDVKGLSLFGKPRSSITSITTSHNLSASNHSNLRPASKDITSTSVLLCGTAVCFLHAHEKIQVGDHQKKEHAI